MAALNGAQRNCKECPSRTPFRADPVRIQDAQELKFDPPLDAGIRDIVVKLVSQGVETFESCEGGNGHAFPEPTVRFEGDTSEGPRAFAVAVAFGLPVSRLRRAWGVRDGMLHGPWWEMTFIPPRSNQPS